MSSQLPDSVVDETHIDWPRFARDFAASLSTKDRASFSAENFTQNAPLQAQLVQKFATPTIQFLLSHSARELWNWISLKDHFELRQTAFRGFQATASKLKHPIVRSRLVTYFEKNRAQILIPLWHYGRGNPPILALLQNNPNSADLPAILREYGVDETLCALTFCGRESLFDEALNALPSFVDETPAGFVDETPKPKSEDERAKTQTAMRELRAKFDSVSVALQKTQTQTEILRAREKVQTDQSTKKFANLEARLNAEIDEIRKREERQARRLKSLEREGEELGLENRRLKKQLRHTQSLLEDERRKNAPEPKVVPEVALQKPTSAPKKPVLATPLDEIFEWIADGRAIRVTARETIRLINRNDEDAVWQIMLALQSLEQSDPEKRFKFLHRLKTIDAYYARVLTSSTTRVLVDASNVARSIPNRFGKGQLVHLLHLREELRRRNVWPLVFIADANLPYQIDEPAKLREMGRSGEIVFVDKGTEADEVLAREARKTGAYVVTNDAKFHLKVSPDFEPPRIGFRAQSDVVFVDEF